MKLMKLSLVLCSMIAAISCSPAYAAPDQLWIDRQCGEITITVTATVDGTYQLRGYREFGEEIGRTFHWTADYRAGEKKEFQDTSFSTVTYWLLERPKGSHDFTRVAWRPSVRINC